MRLHTGTSILCFARSWLGPAMLWSQTWDQSVLCGLCTCVEEKKGKQKQFFPLPHRHVSASGANTEQLLFPLSWRAKICRVSFPVHLAFILVSVANQKFAPNQCMRPFLTINATLFQIANVYQNSFPAFKHFLWTTVSTYFFPVDLEFTVFFSRQE